MPDYGPPPTDTVTLGGGAWQDPKGDRPRRTGWYVAGAGVAAVALIAGGTVFAATHVSSDRDPGPAAGLPRGTLAYAAVDLDPSAGQKIEALKALRRLPAFTEGVKTDPSVDLRKLMLQDQLKGAGCALDWDKDVAPWLGNDIGGAIVPTAGEPQPVAIVAVSDETAAKKELPRLLDCAKLPHGLSIANGWAVIATNDTVAQGVSTAAKHGSLADDEDFTTWVDRTGDPGVATFYESKDAGTTLAGSLDKMRSQLGSGMFTRGGSSSDGADWSMSWPDTETSSAYSSKLTVTGDDGLSPTDPMFGPMFGMLHLCPSPGAAASGGSSSPAPDASQLELEKQQLSRLQGGAATLRFAGGGFELESAATSASTGNTGSTGGSAGVPTGDLASLPGDTAVALGAGFDRNAFAQALDGFVASVAAGCGSTSGALLGALDDRTGLELPQDAVTLLGSGATFALGGGLDPAVFEGPTVPTKDFPVGFRLKGDPAQIQAVLAKLQGADAQQLLATSSGDGIVAVGPDAAYRAELLKKGDLGSRSTFKDVVPHADQARAVAYVDFGQLARVFARTDDADSQRAAKNMAHLSALGASGWVQDGIAHGLVRLSTK